MKKIVSLTNVFIKEYYQNLPIFDNKNKKFNKKSIFYWLIVIIFFAVGYVSYEIIKFLTNIGQSEIFINLYLPILTMFLAFQVILSCANVFFFSKDTENVLYMPINSVELLISKFITLLCMLYFSEGIIAVVPLTLYGMITSANFVYYIWAIVTIFIYPIFVSGAISILTFVIMKFSRFFRNKEVFQIFMTVFLIFTILIVEYIMLNNLFNIKSNEDAFNQMISIQDRMQNINRMLLIVNPTINMLASPEKILAVVSFLKILAICSIEIIVFLLVGNITYIKYILKNITSIERKKGTKKIIDINKKVKNNKIGIAYTTKEFKLLLRNPSFFMQCVFPVITLLISCILLVVSVYPTMMNVMQDDTVKKAIENMSFNTEVVCDILIILQVMYSISNISLTAISRDGKDATLIKYIPVSLYKQFLYKNIPQFMLNLLTTIVVLGLIWYIIPSIKIIYMFIIFIISIMINLINCYLMLIVDLKRPNLNWATEEAVVKKSDNKLFQYVLMIVNILLLLYIATIFKSINIMLAMTIECIIYTILFIIIDRCVKKWQYKLFNKIQ
ncbi:MAG: hypothetical protein IKF17_03550 [Clostridia bacterium]|nr:hypothetical protein [Clostridia bacterium]